MAQIEIKEFGKVAYKCNKCNHVWFSRGDERPLTCPKCKTARWDKPQKQDLKNKISSNIQPSKGLNANTKGK